MGGIGRRQGGAGLMGLMLWLVVGVMVMTLGFKLAPPYMEFLTVKSVMDTVAKDPELAGKGRALIMSSLGKRLDINSVRGVPNDAFKIEQQASGWDLVADYEVRVPLLYNVDALLTFEHRAPLSR